MKEKIKINNWVFWPPFAILFASAVFSFVDDKKFGAVLKSVFDWSVNTFGWMYLLVSFLFAVICMVLYCSKLGSIKFGGENATPEFSYWNWFAMSLCGGIGVGIIFWGVAEPIIHFTGPPASLGLEPLSAEAAVFAMSTCFLHWTITPYSMYAICAIPIGLAVYNHNQPFRVSSSLYFILGKKTQGPIGNMVDGFCLFGIASGVIVALGTGLMQIGSGLEFVFGITPTTVVWGLIAIVIIIAYTLSSHTGLQKGIKFLSDQNAKLFLVVMLFIFFAGPSRFIGELGTQSFGEYLVSFPTKSLWLGVVADDQWPRWWTIFYWAVWMVFAPIVGLFLARLVRGRTIRQFITVNLMAPGLFGMVWFAIFGGASINLQLKGIFDIAATIGEKGVESAAFIFFQQFPLGAILVPLFVFIICISFITLADSMTTCMASLSMIGLDPLNPEAPTYMKVIWGCIIGILAHFIVSFAGIEGIKMVSFITGFPMMFMMIAIAFSLVVALTSERFKQTNPATLVKNDNTDMVNKHENN